MLRLVFISDTHGMLPDETPPCDVLVHCGDIGPFCDNAGQRAYLNCRFLPWLNEQPALHKIFIPGNHDSMFQDEPNEPLLLHKRVTFLLDSSVTIGGLKFYGSPWVPWYRDFSFNSPRYEPDSTEFMKSKWSHIPYDTQVLITHCPPNGILDHQAYKNPTHLGCNELRKRVESLKHIKVHAFGHLHENKQKHDSDGRVFVNASMTVNDIERGLVKAPVIVDLELNA